MENSSYFWKSDDDTYNYYEDYSQLQNQQLDFNSVDTFGNPVGAPLYEPAAYSHSTEFEDEPPLLEELEIYPERILQKVLAILNPFKGHGLTDDAEYLTKESDLAGPVFFYLVLAACLFLSGNKAHFGYVYIISLISWIFMYNLLRLMTLQDVFTLPMVASVLGYSLVPIVGLSIFRLFFSFNGFLVLLLATLTVFWSSLSASRLFVVISGDNEQQLLIGYPCALVSAIYVIVIIF